jgi:Epoxide hydrolase N terminus
MKLGAIHSIATAHARGPDRESTRFRRNDYDWRKVEARLNALPQFVTEIDGARYPFHPRSFET